jgi:regulator of RNase E activity RraA
MRTDDETLFAKIRESLFTAVVGDILDANGYLHQFLPPGIHPLRDDMVVIGRAMPVVEADIPVEGGPPEKQAPFGLMLHALDDLHANEVYVCTGGSPAYATWGEIMTTRAKHLGAVGAVVNGYSRDTRGILKLDFPVFSLGRYAQDQRPRGKVVDFRVPIQIGQVKISPGDLVFGDLDGVLVVPRSIEQDILDQALEKAHKENVVRNAIEKDGVSSVDAFATYGVM